MSLSFPSEADGLEDFYKWRAFALWYNAYTGRTEALNDFITIKSMRGAISPEGQTENFAMVLEHLLPQDGGSNPVLDRA